MSPTYDIAIIGGGIVGMATAMELSQKTAASIVVLEAEDHLAAHQTGHNSGVIHSGIYYKPGSLKARNCTQGRIALYRFCEEHGIAHDNCGKVIVATQTRELPALDTLEKRGHENGLVGLRRLTAEEIKEYEPHASGIAGLFVRETGIVDYKHVTRKHGQILQSGGGEVLTSARVTKVHKSPPEFLLEPPRGEIHA